MEWEEEFAAFCAEEHPRLEGALSLYCGDRVVAEELAQDALSKTCRDWRKVRHLGAPGAWTHRVAINLANSYFRRVAAEGRAKRRFQDEQNVRRDSGMDPVMALDIRKVVASLPRRQRTALILRYYVDMSVREVAEVMDCPEGTVKTLQWYDPTRDAWSTPVEMPLDFDECYPDSVVAKDLVFAFFCGRAALFSRSVLLGSLETWPFPRAAKPSSCSLTEVGAAGVALGTWRSLPHCKSRVWGRCCSIF